MDGGIRGFLGVVAAHRGAVEYDFRTRFGFGLIEIGRSVTITEAARLFGVLAQDTGSWTCAALNGWDAPVSRESVLLADVFDALAAGNWQRGGGRGQRPKPWPRWWTRPSGETKGKGVAVSKDHFHALWAEVREAASSPRA